MYLSSDRWDCWIAGVSHSRKTSRTASSTSGGGVAGRRGKRKRPPVEEDDDDDDGDDGFMEGSEGGERVKIVEGRERYVNSLVCLQLTIK